MLERMIFEIVQQKISRRHKRKLAEFLIVFGVVRHNDITTCSKSTLVLQQVFEIAHGSMVQCRIKLMCVARQYSKTFTKIVKNFMTFCFCSFFQNIVQIGKGKIRSTHLENATCSELEYHSTLLREFAIICYIHKDIGVKKNFHFRSSPKIHLVRSSAASSGVRRSASNSSLTSGEISISAIFFARNSSSAFRLDSSASRTVSFRNSITTLMSLMFIPRMIPMYGAIGVSDTLCANVVITSLYLIQI